MSPSHTKILRAEGAAVALALGIIAWQAGPPWQLVVAVLVFPDLGFVAYLAGPRIGAIIYNVLHSYIGPALLAAITLAIAPIPYAWEIAILWALHIGADRFLGYGLKSEEGFKVTHLGRL